MKNNKLTLNLKDIRIINEDDKDELQKNLIKCGCKPFKEKDTNEYKQKILIRARKFIDTIYQNMGFLSELFEENHETYDLLNSIPNYPENWHSLDEEACLVAKYLDSVDKMLKNYN